MLYFTYLLLWRCQKKRWKKSQIQLDDAGKDGKGPDRSNYNECTDVWYRRSAPLKMKAQVFNVSVCAGGEDLPWCGESRERFCRHTHLSATHVEHAQRGAVLPAVHRGGLNIRTQDGGGILVSVCVCMHVSESFIQSCMVKSSFMCARWWRDTCECVCMHACMQARASFSHARLKTTFICVQDGGGIHVSKCACM